MMLQPAHFSAFRCVDAKTDDDRQVGLGFDPGNFRADIARLGLCRAGDPGD